MKGMCLKCNGSMVIDMVRNIRHAHDTNGQMKRPPNGGLYPGWPVFGRAKFLVVCVTGANGGLHGHQGGMARQARIPLSLAGHSWQVW